MTVTALLFAFFVATSVVPWVVDLLTDKDTAPDKPWPFGYRTAWLAIATEETEGVLEALRLENIQCVNWRTGIATTYDEELGEHFVFVSPPVAGWTFVVGLALPHPVGPRFEDTCMPLLAALSRRFGEVQYYFTYPFIEHYAWARFSGGGLVRAFAWGDEGIIWNRGRITEEERALGLKVFALRRLGGRSGKARKARDDDDPTGYPNEEAVLAMARAWGLDPTRIDREPTPPGLGFVGEVPLTWRARRKRERPAVYNNTSAIASTAVPPPPHGP